MKLWILLIILTVVPIGQAASLRIEGERAWLNAVDGASLQEVLQLFGDRGVEVLVDPTLKLNSITGEWENTAIERLIAQLARPHSYLVEWKRVDSSLGTLYQVSSIRIFADGNSDAAKPLKQKRKVLDVVTGKNGLKYIRNEIMIGFDEEAGVEDLHALLRKINGTMIEVINPPGIYRIRLNDDLSVEDAMALANAHDGVASSEPNLAFPRLDAAPVSVSAPDQRINLNLQPGETAVAVFDSGLDPKYVDHPLIRGTYDAVDPSAAISDPSGHGTLTAMVAAGAITPLGAEPAETGVPVLAIRTFDENGMTSSDTIYRALEFAANSDVNIISMSWGSKVDSHFLQTAMDFAALNGMTLYASAGNEPTGVPIYPAGYGSVIAVGGLDSEGNLWDQSNYGDFVSSYGPAFAYFNGKLYTGTSIATPKIAAEAAKARSAKTLPVK
ncbi:MAG TPA: S8 family serine peptidase [Pontiella sp.]